jgi:large subunit ribosomal protein L15
MTKYHELQVSATPDRKRVGRGISAGQGKTAGRGTKGQGARTGKKLRPTFQGGSGALVRRTPKARGFKSLRTAAQVVYLDHLNGLKAKTIDNFALYEADLIGTPFHAVKVIVRGELTDKVNLHVAGASKTVQAAITKAGGTFVKTPVPLKQSTKEAEAADKK